MTKVLIYSSITGLSLFAGAYLGLLLNLKQKILAGIMAFGSGVLVCALTFGLMEEAFNLGGFDAVLFGFFFGGIVFILGDYIILGLGGRSHKDQGKKVKVGANGVAIAFGALIDGIPESIALGIALFSNSGLGLLMLIAIALSNFPEGISSVKGLVREGYRRWQILLIWSFVALSVIVVTILSFKFLGNLNGNTVGILESFAAGAILAMLADAMMPEAFEDGGAVIGILTVLGFMLAFIIQKI